MWTLITIPSLLTLPLPLACLTRSLTVFPSLVVFEKCRRMQRQRCMSKNWKYSWQWKSSRTRQQYYRSASFAIKTDILMNGSLVRIQCNTENFVLVVVPGSSASSSYGSESPTSRTLSRQESHCSTSSSSSSSPPTVSETKTRKREDRIESDISPVTVSTSVDDRSGRPVVDQANKTLKTDKKEPQKERVKPL